MEHDHLMGINLLFGLMKNVLKMDSGDGYAMLSVSLRPLSCIFRNG